MVHTLESGIHTCLYIELNDSYLWSSSEKSLFELTKLPLLLPSLCVILKKKEKVHFYSQLTYMYVQIQMKYLSNQITTKYIVIE